MAGHGCQRNHSPSTGIASVDSVLTAKNGAGLARAGSDEHLAVGCGRNRSELDKCFWVGTTRQQRQSCRR